MLSYTNLTAFALVSLGMVLTPGPNMIYLLSRAVLQGRVAGFVSLLGVIAGFIFYMLCAAFGVTALIFALPFAFPPTMLGHAAFHQPAQRSELFRQVPALQRGGLIQGIDLLLDQRQVVDRVEDDVFPIPAPRMASNDLATAADHHLVDIAPHPDVLMTLGDRHGIVVGLVAHQGLGRYAGAGLIAGIEG